LINHYMLKGRIETEAGNFSAAFRYFREALKEIREHGQPFLEMFLDCEMSRTYRRQGNDRSAAAYLGQALDLSRKMDFDYALIGRGRHDLSEIEYGLKHGIQTDYLRQILSRIHTDEARRLLNQSSLDRGAVDLTCEFLGNFTFRDKAGQPIEPRWRTQKGKALFVMLVLNRPNGCTKDQLIDGLWPEKDLPDATHSLQVEISALRNLLKETGRTEIPAKSLIVFQGQRYRLARDLLIKSDIQDLDELFKTAEGLEKKNRKAGAELLERSLGLYRGEFCADINEECLENPRLLYRDRRLKILKKLGAHHLADGRYQQALEFLEAASGLDDFDEAIHTDIMRCYAGLGDRKGVQKRFSILAAKLKELGIDAVPGPAAEIVKSLK
jgi:two-component SAPR family response regulator